jgi:Fe-S-cluster-containing dehydrogenase component
VQRIQNAKIKAKNAGRPLQDGEITPACAQTCPTEAIVFGDLNDPDSRASRRRADKRSYDLLTYLNIKPRTNYMARIRNPHPRLASRYAPAGPGESPAAPDHAGSNAGRNE